MPGRKTEKQITAYATHQYKPVDSPKYSKKGQKPNITGKDNVENLSLKKPDSAFLGT